MNDELSKLKINDNLLERRKKRIGEQSLLFSRQITEISHSISTVLEKMIEICKGKEFVFNQGPLYFEKKVKLLEEILEKMDSTYFKNNEQNEMIDGLIELWTMYDLIGESEIDSESIEIDSIKSFENSDNETDWVYFKILEYGKYSKYSYDKKTMDRFLDRFRYLSFLVDKVHLILVNKFSTN